MAPDHLTAISPSRGGTDTKIWFPNWLLIVSIKKVIAGGLAKLVERAGGMKIAAPRFPGLGDGYNLLGARGTRRDQSGC